MARPKGAKGCTVASVAANKRKGRLSAAERSAIEGVAAGPLDVEKAAEKLAPALGRSEAAIAQAIRDARENFQSRAGAYEELLFKSAQIAAVKGNHKPALDALDRLVGPKGERVVDPPPSAAANDYGGGIKIVLANVRLGGIKPQELPAAEIIDVERA